MIGNIIYAINICFYAYALIIVARCLLTWLPNINWNNPIIKFIKESSDIYLDLFKKFIPPIGPFDISPVVAIFALQIMNFIINYIVIFIFRLFGAV